MATIIFFIAAVVSILQAIIGFSYFITCVWEKEFRATFFGGIQFLLMTGLVFLLFYLEATGFFKTGFGLTVLVLGLIIAVGLGVLLIQKVGLNPKALEGTQGLIVGHVKRYDERDIMFARNRTIRPGTGSPSNNISLLPFKFDQLVAD